MKINIDEGALYIVRKLEDKGFEAYVVGGCVRDSLMGKTPDDWDITTSARPEDVIEIFEKTVPTGIKHGTVTVIYKGRTYEVTTYRIDGRYENHRSPESVEFSKNLLDDLSRRDFTINAMAYNHRILVDEFGGYDDINNRKIKCVGDPDLRFEEDALRIMRAVRFSAKLGFSIDKNTLDSIYKKSDNLRFISKERINSELEKTIFYDVKKLGLFREIGLFDWLIGGFNISDQRLAIADRLESCIEEFKHEKIFYENVKIRSNTDIKKAIIFKEMSEKDFLKLLGDLRYPKKSINTSLNIKTVLEDKRFSEMDYCKDIVKLKKLIKWVLRDVGDVDIAKIAIFTLFIEKNTNPSLCLKVFDDIIEVGECFSISSLEVNGSDIVSKNIASGRAVGQILERLLDFCIEDPTLNERSRLIDLAIKISKNDMEE